MLLYCVDNVYFIILHLPYSLKWILANKNKYSSCLPFLFLLKGLYIVSSFTQNILKYLTLSSFSTFSFNEYKKMFLKFLKIVCRHGRFYSVVLFELVLPNYRVFINCTMFRALKGIKNPFFPSKFILQSYHNHIKILKCSDQILMQNYCSVMND